jgi:hypothetical protein
VTQFLKQSFQGVVFKDLSETASGEAFPKLPKKVLGAYKKIWLHQKNFDGSKNL